jgi:CRP/FNR family transcriptional regulator
VKAVYREILARSGLLQDLTNEEAEAISSKVWKRHYAKGQMIFAQGDPSNSIYIIEQGRVKISRQTADGKELVLFSMGEGRYFGEAALFEGEPRHADATAIEPTDLLVIMRDDFVHLIETHPRIALVLLAGLSRRLRNADQKTEDAIFQDVPTRIIRALLRIANGAGEVIEDGIVIKRSLTQSELASIVGTSRESINKWLRSFEKQGLIRYEGRTITLLQPETLHKRAYF